jgi:uncharacterized protein (TIGR00162 family)
MNKTKIFYKKMKFNKPVMIVGLPGIGNVGSMVCEHIKNEIGAKKFATLYSPHFPHQAIMLKNGMLRLVNNRFYYAKNAVKHGKEKHDLIILLGDIQAMTPEGQYDINEKIVRFFKHLGGHEIYTIAGYNSAKGKAENQKVFGLTTDKKMIETLKRHGIIFGEAQGTIFGASGLIVAFGKKHMIPSACIMGETEMLDVDADAAKRVLEVLQGVLGISISMENIDHLIKATRKMMRDIEEMVKESEGGAMPAPNPENFTYIR